MLLGSSIRRDPTVKSNTELVASFRSHFAANSTVPETNGNVVSHASTGNSASERAHYRSWTHMADDGRRELEIPKIDFERSGLVEEREQYDITLKLFFLPGSTAAHRDTRTREAVKLVLKELHVQSIDLLIVSFPGIYFDEEEDCPEKLSTRGPVQVDPEPLDTQLHSWNTLEALQEEGVVKRIGIAEFGHDRLASFLEKARIPPTVNQINLRDCCSVPKELLSLAKSRGVELLVHNDCSDILPRGTVRELLGPEEGGAGVLAHPDRTSGKRKSLHEVSQNGTVEVSSDAAATI